VAVFPVVTVSEPCALRNPLEVATAVYDPAGTERENVPFVFADVDAARVVSARYKLIVTGLESV
jgi:hypothetical protein